MARSPTAAADASRARRLAPRLLRWYEREQRALPWRQNPTPYSVWVSEVMLQQTRVGAVVDRYRAFLQRFPTLEQLARADVDEVLALWSGLGYYRRARSLHEGARAVLRDHDGRFPRDLARALELPGVGPYTAGAVLSIAYGLPVAAIDGNVERVVTRLLQLPGDPRKAPTARHIRDAVEGWLPRSRASHFNQALMELGATVCTPKAPRCASCPLASICSARESDTPLEFPQTASPRPSEVVRLHAAVVQRGERFLLERIERGAFLRGLWLFPFAESPKALLASLEDNLGVPFRIHQSLGQARHAITFRRITVTAYRCEPERPWRRRKTAAAQAWIRLQDLGETVAVSSLAFKVARLIG